MDPHDARTALDRINASEEQVIAEAKRWPRPWHYVTFAIAVGAMMSIGDLDGRPALMWLVGGIGTAAVVVLSVVNVVRFRRNRVMVHATRYAPRTFWIWLVSTAVMIAIGIGGPPALTAIGVPVPFTASGALFAIVLWATAVTTNRAVRPRTPQPDA